MRTEAHWKETEDQLAYIEAHRVSIQLKELAKTQGYDPKGVKVYSKKYAIDMGFGRAGSIIKWLEGPDNWADDILPFLKTNVSVIARDKMILFYDR